MAETPSVLIVEARYYEDVSELLAQGAIAALEAAGAAVERVSVPGALEIPAAIALAEREAPGRHDGYVALGCVIRGQTGHYDIVAGESARALMDLTLFDGVALGNGILTTETKQQALVRADPAAKNKGRDAAEACLALIALKARFAARA